MSLIDDIALCTLGGLTLCDTTDTTGLGWSLVDISGWEGRKKKYQAPTRQMAHGNHQISWRWATSQAIVLKAEFCHPDRALIRGAADALDALGMDGAMVDLAVTTALGTRTRSVDVQGVTPLDEGTWQAGLATFQVDCTALDPRMYGDPVPGSTGVPIAGTGELLPETYPVNFGTEGDPGRIELINAGTAETTVQMVVTGGLSSGVAIKRIETNQTVQVGWPILDGQSVVFDTESHTVKLNGQSDLSRYLGSSEWFTVGKGETCTLQFLPLGTQTGTPTLTATLRPAWW